MVALRCPPLARKNVPYAACCASSFAAFAARFCARFRRQTGAGRGMDIIEPHIEQVFSQQHNRASWRHDGIAARKRVMTFRHCAFSLLRVRAAIILHRKRLRITLWLFYRSAKKQLIFSPRRISSAVFARGIARLAASSRAGTRSAARFTGMLHHRAYFAWRQHRSAIVKLFTF